MRGRARARRRGARRVRALGGAGHADRLRHRRRPRCACSSAAPRSADLPVAILVDDCPLYDLEPGRPSEPLYRAAAGGADRRRAGGPSCCWRCCGSANLASRRPVFEQYDPVVQSRTVRRPDEADAAVLALPGGAAIAVSIDGNGRRVACDPRRGAAEAVYECAANLACVGAEPLGLTNCLNFGNPEKPHVAWQLTEAVDGPGRGLRGARRAGRRRQRVALQRGADRPDLPHAGRRHRRAAPRCRAGPAGSASRTRATRSRWSGRSSPSLAGSELAKLQGDAAARAAAADRRGRRSAQAHERVRERVRVRRAAQRPRHRRGRASRSRWPSAASPAGSARP